MDAELVLGSGFWVTEKMRVKKDSSEVQIPLLSPHGWVQGSRREDGINEDDDGIEWMILQTTSYCV